jgi:hypothetical protein
MSFSSLLVILFLGWNIQGRIIHTDDTCETHIYDLKSCSAVLTFAGNCQSMKVNLTDTEYVKCSSMLFFWSYPLNNLTLIIEQHQPYQMSLDNEQLTGAITNLYRIINNEEKEITSQDKTIVQDSDSKNEIILKFQGPTRLGRYGVNISYKTIETIKI